MLVDISRIRSKSPALSYCVGNKNVFPLSKLIVTLLISNNDLAISDILQFYDNCPRGKSLPNPKTNLNPNPNPIPNRGKGGGGQSSSGAIVQIPSLPISFILKVSLLAC